MLKNVALACAVCLLTLLASLGALRRLAPRLAGVPLEVRYVQSDQQVPPFFKNAFERAGTNDEVADPVTVVRAAGLQAERPGAGPTDLLGFRNQGVPNSAELVAIGDSQTYGVGVDFRESWPQQLQARLGERLVYSMACAGWGPTQYLVMARLAGVFRPKTVIVAYYTGNDPHDAFAEAYNKPRWRSLRVNRALTSSDQPPAFWPIPDDDQWQVKFRGGLTTVFTPRYRFASNDRSLPGVREGYAIIGRTAALISDALAQVRARVLFIVIPTKELVYSARVRGEGVRAPKAYDALVSDELRNIEELAALLREVPRSAYVDVVGPLQRAALGGTALYPSDLGGHPRAAGFSVIAEALAAALPAASASPANAAARSVP